ncbi:hypothetical protein ACIRSU_01575 [Streptomyces sp. NPDC101160]|uniref:hypothetical protein n=1 Tax=Streptomyces sp. NPDC101160 TaxID=3366118 RepID=UPI00381BB71A
MTTGRCSRGVRAAMFAAVCVLLAATGHLLMSGQDLPAPALGLAFMGTLAVAWVLAGRERGLLAVTTATVAVQSALHAVFSWYQQDSVMPMPHMQAGQAETGHADMVHTGMGRASMGHMSMAHEAVGQISAGHMSLGHPAMDQAAVAHDMTDMSSSFGMLSAHLLAALLSGLWMAYGERAVFRLVRALPLGLFRPLRLLLAAVVPVPSQAPRLRPVRAGDERAPGQLLLAHSVISRGPPRAVAVA